MHQTDRLIADLAVRRGWVTEEDARRLLDEREGRAGETDEESLASRLLARGLIDDSQMRHLKEDRRRHRHVIGRFEEIRKSDEAMARVLAARGSVEEPRLAEAFRAREAALERGEPRRLGDILVEMGALSRDALVDALRYMSPSALRCSACGAVHSPGGDPGAKPLTCPDCGHPLVDPETFNAMRREPIEPPEEVRAVESLPDRECGKFVLVRCVGSGGMGTVWKAWDRHLGRWVAIKFIKTSGDPAQQDEDVRRFLREAHSAARLRHPNIVTVYEAGELRDRHAIVMEFIEGRLLRDANLPIRRALEVLRDVARAVHYAHEQGVAHRDLKPSNVMIGTDQRPHVMDFGLARSLTRRSDLTRSGDVVGTPMYMAPERARGARHPDDVLCDVYSLGATLYEQMVGAPPFDGLDPYRVLHDVLKKEPVPPRQRNPAVPRDVETITLKALHKQPSKRYASAKELADDIDRHLRGEPVLARRPRLGERVWAWAKRHPGVSAVATTSLVVVAAFITVSTALRQARVEQSLESAREAFKKFRRTIERVDQVESRLAESTNVTPAAQREMERERKEELDRLGQCMTRVLEECNKVVGLVHEHPEAKALARDATWERFLLAERQMSDEAALLRTLLEAQGDPRLREPGVLRLRSDPPGAQVEYRLTVEDHDGRLIEGVGRALGVTPLRDVSIPSGSGVLLLQSLGCRETRLPVLAPRGRALELTVRLYREEDLAELGEGFVPVPAGTFIYGDPRAMRARYPSVQWAGDFFISKWEVTYAQYARFLTELPRNEAESHYPARWKGHRDLDLDRENGVYSAPASLKDLPVRWILWEDAVRYCEELTRKSTRWTYRLPTSVEWEKAARGVDGRAFPWGEAFDWRFTVGAFSPAEPLLTFMKIPARVGSVSFDVSPYGAYDMAGNVAEWCFDWQDELDLHVVRGGWFGWKVDRSFRCASYEVAGQTRQLWNGFRIVAVPKP
ncbi:MAG: SUMF1/EgtB/PvdO family nonheme iron enzyme [Planctomycetes bacterium]|nr:SUMF1/EgtB/PvdO family nonheme iron enzyme [Planctomycetota bacterium]